MRLVSGLNQPGQTGSAGSYLPKFSADGQHIVFISQAKNLVTNDDQGTFFDVFVHDLTSSNTTLVSVNLSDVGGGNDHSLLPSVSSNGQFIAFASASTNLVSHDTNRISDVFMRDVAAGVTRLVSVNAEGNSSGNGASTAPLISEDGRFVIFESAASNLVTNDFNGTNDVFAHDLITGVTALVSVDAEGRASGNGPSSQPSISADGRFVAFASLATNLVAGVTNNLPEIYVRDLLAGTTIWASSYRPWPLEATLRERNQFTGLSWNYGFRAPTLSRNGRYVAYKAGNPTLYTTDFAVFRRDLQHTSSGAAWQFMAMTEHTLSLSDDGRYVVFGGALIDRLFYRSTNTVVRMDAESEYLWRVNLQPFLCYGTIELVGVSNWIGGASSWSHAATLDGNRIVFVSDATNLVSGTDAPRSRLYLRDMAAHTTVLLSDRLNRALETTVPVISQDGTRVAFDTSDATLATNDLNRAGDVFVEEVSSGAVSLISRAQVDRPAATGNALAWLSGQALSANGHKVVFLSFDNSLVPHDTNRWSDAFARDLLSGEVVGVGGPLIPRSVSGGEMDLIGHTNSAVSASISADGRFVLVDRVRGIGASSATNIYRNDLDLGSTGYLISILITPSWIGTFRTLAALMSQNGQVVAFHSSDEARLFLSPPIGVVDGNNSLDVVTREFGDPWVTNSFERQPPTNLPRSQIVSLNRFGTATGNGASWQPVISLDGRWVTFQSLATDLTDNTFPLPNRPQLFARDLDLRQTKLISRDTNGVAFHQGASNAVISADSCYVFFQGAADFTIYRHDLEMDSSGPSNTILLPHLIVCTNCANPSVSAVGTLVAYQVLRPGGAANDIVVRDLGSGAEELITVDSDGNGGANGPSESPMLSYDGRFVVFASKASNLVSNDNNNASDIFVRDHWMGVTFLASLNYHGTGSANGPSSQPVLSADGRSVAFQSFASDLVPGDYNDTRDVFVLSLTGPDTDNDGLEDDWEMAYFDTLDRDGMGDFDGDGQTDAQEERAGTDPTDGGSIFRVLTLSSVQQASQTVTNRAMTLLWRAAPGRTYRVQFKDEVTDSEWQKVPGDVTAASITASKVHIALPFSGNASRRFYRVVLLE